MMLRIQPVTEERLSPLVGDLYDLGCVTAIYTVDELLVAFFADVDKSTVENTIDKDRENFEWIV